MAFCTMMPGSGLVSAFHDSGGRGKPIQGGLKVCWADSTEQGAATAHRLWRNELLPGGLPQTLPEPRDFEAATTLITEDSVTEHFPCGPDQQKVLERIEQFRDAGFDELYVQQIRPEQEKFFEAWKNQLAPSYRHREPSRGTP
jgi:G6PDH family F420-dependent oxidoreductase